MAQIRTDVSKKQMVEALKLNRGCVLDACKEVGIGRSTHYRWMDEDEDYKDAILEITEGVVDKAEQKLLSLIEQGDTTATIFFLKTKGKKRGYVEKSEVEVSAPITLNFAPIGSGDK